MFRQPLHNESMFLAIINTDKFSPIHLPVITHYNEITQLSLYTDFYFNFNSFNQTKRFH